jgi:hypothetical protein
MLRYKPDKAKMIGDNGGYLTQSLFLELGYDPNAIYTLGEEDKTYKGKLLPSIKKLYLQAEDLGEYDFATTYFCSWKHWQRLLGNKVILKHIEEWREELEIKIRSAAIKEISEMPDSFQAAKWLADRGWDKRAAGRPSKDEQAKEKRIAQSISDEFKGDIIRLKDVK